MSLMTLGCEGLWSAEELDACNCAKLAMPPKCIPLLEGDSERKDNQG